MAQALLFGADGLTGLLAQHAIHRTDVVATNHEQTLQLSPLGA
jgi:hypothetical protein